MAPPQYTLESLGSTIAELTKVLSVQLQNAKHPEPSLDANAPESLPPTPEIQGTRVQLQEALLTLYHLATGPSEFWFQQAFTLSNDPLTVDVLNHFNFWDAVPLEGSASYAEIAKATKLPEQIVRRFLRDAFAKFIFAEEGPNTDRVIHTAASAHVARNRLVRSMLGHSMQDVRPAAAVGVEALEKWFVGTTELTEDREHCAFPLATDNGKQRQTDLWTFCDNYERPGQPKGYRAKQFAEAMQSLGASMSEGVKSVLELYDWDSLGKAKVVDLGGSAGHISTVLAHNHPKLDLVVQDLSGAESAFNANIESEGLQSRIKFQAYDFFQKQELPADVYLIKSIFHDWSDKYVVEILQNQLTVLKPGNRVIIFDGIVPPDYDENGNHVLPLTARRLIASVDLQMHVSFNAKERKVEDWVAVVKRAYAKFELSGVHTLPGFPFGLLVFEFQG